MKSFHRVWIKRYEVNAKKIMDQTPLRISVDPNGRGLGIGKPLTAVKDAESYNIVLGQDYRAYCTCPAWKFSKPPIKECKHLIELFDVEGDSVMLELQKPRVVDSRDKASIRPVIL